MREPVSRPFCETKQPLILLKISRAKPVVGTAIGFAQNSASFLSLFPSPPRKILGVESHEATNRNRFVSTRSRTLLLFRDLPKYSTYIWMLQISMATASAGRSLTFSPPAPFFRLSSFRLVPSPKNRTYLPRIFAIIWTPSAATEIARHAFI